MTSHRVAVKTYGIIGIDSKKGDPMTNEKEAPKGRDGAQYMRQQKGHSLIKHILLIFVGVGIFTIPYISLSKNHYWHA